MEKALEKEPMGMFQETISGMSLVPEKAFNRILSPIVTEDWSK